MIYLFKPSWFRRMTYSIRDESGSEQFTTRRRFALGEKIILRDAAKREVARIRQRVAWGYRMEISRDGALMATLTRGFLAFERCGIDWVGRLLEIRQVSDEDDLLAFGDEVWARIHHFGALSRADQFMSHRVEIEAGEHASILAILIAFLATMPTRGGGD